MVAGVYVLDVPYHVDIMYTYEIPTVLAEKAVRGAVVGVPFGRGNRLSQGMVFSVSEEDAKSLKEIITVLDEEPILAASEHIEVIPTLVLYRGGQALGSIVAPESKAMIEAFIQESLAK